MPKEGGGGHRSVPGPHALPVPTVLVEPGSPAANVPASAGFYVTNDDEAACEIVENEL